MDREGYSNKTTALLDEEIVNTLVNLMGTGFAALKQTFINNATRKIAELHQAIAARDVERTKLVAHSLKGSCSTIGAKEMATLAKKIEDAIAETDQTLITTLAQVLEQRFKATAIKLDDYPTPE